MTNSDVARCALAILLACAAPVAGSDDQTATIPNADPAPHYTQTLRVKAPKVQVRSNPKASSENAPGAGQYAFVDENGELTSTPPADFEFPETGDARAVDPVPRRSTVDPKATLIDTSHIRAVMRVRLDEHGKPAVECLHSTDPALQKTCTQPHTPVAKPTEPAAQEDDQ